ncbi:MAG: guanylate kinase [Candidatus Gastranaerophilales bacterium]|nr:guanylate kinase [Candidatus Gastranaerophilales bacterium]
MIIVLLGASGSGKSTIENELATHHGFEKIISYTTRKPRDGEVNGKDYFFTENNTFAAMINTGVMAEYDEYSQGRLYGTLKSDYTDGDKVVVLTPNGIRQLKQSCPNDNIFTVLVNANLGTRVKRYIDRCGVDKFNFDDKNEIGARVECDFGMFLGLDKEVNLIVDNNEGTDIDEIIKIILDYTNRNGGKQ